MEKRVTKVIKTCTLNLIKNTKISMEVDKCKQGFIQIDEKDIKWKKSGHKI